MNTHHVYPGCPVYFGKRASGRIRAYVQSYPALVADALEHPPAYGITRREAHALAGVLKGKQSIQIAAELRTPDSKIPDLLKSGMRKVFSPNPMACKTEDVLFFNGGEIAEGIASSLSALTPEQRCVLGEALKGSCHRQIASNRQTSRPNISQIIRRGLINLEFWPPKPPEIDLLGR